MKKHHVINMLLDKEAKEQGYSIEQRDAFMAGIDAILEYTHGTNKVELELYPDPEHDTHWEREKVKFLREGFRSGYSLHKMFVEIKMMQEKYKKLNDADT